MKKTKMERAARRALKNAINSDNSLGPTYGHYICWNLDEKITLDSEFTLDELEALAWWIRNHK